MTTEDKPTNNKNEDNIKPEDEVPEEETNIEDENIEITEEPDEDFDLNEEDENEEDDDEELERPKSRTRKSSSAPANEDDEEEDDLEDGDEEEGEGADLGEDEEGRAIKKQKTSSKAAPKVKGRRGRKPNIATVPLFDDDGKEYGVADDEFLLPEDEEGETKISKLGELQGGRLFRVRTFTVKGKGDRLYMLSTEPARCMGFRDSYLLFQKHRLLYKVVLTQDEKYDLIDRDIIPHSYKGRVIGLVTARSIFREFGAKIIVGGRHITDDYYAGKIRERGLVSEGQLADPADVIPPKGIEYNQNQFVAWHGASSVYHTSAYIPPPQYFEPLELKSIKSLKSTTNMDEETWMFQHANSVRNFERELLKGRLLISRGLRDPYTGITLVPSSTQPTHTSYIKIEDPSDYKPAKKQKLIFDTVVASNSLAKYTGLSDVPLEIFEGTVNEEVMKAILKQQELERNQYA